MESRSDEVHSIGESGGVATTAARIRLDREFAAEISVGLEVDTYDPWLGQSKAHKITPTVQNILGHVLLLQLCDGSAADTQQPDWAPL